MDGSTNILDLPDEMIVYILKKISLFYLKKYRLVSRRFKFLIDNMSRKKLIFLHDFYFIRAPFDVIGLDLEFDYKNSIRLPKNLNDFFKISLFKRMINSVKELIFLAPNALNLDHFHNFDLQILNEFLNLEKLFLINMNTEFSSCSINMPKLKDLKIEFRVCRLYYNKHLLDSKSFIINIESKIDKLTLELIPRVIRLEIKYPELITYLEIIESLSIYDYYILNIFFPLENLKTLKMTYISVPSKKQILQLMEQSKLENLYLEFAYIYVGSLDPLNGKEYQIMLDGLDELIELKNQSKISIKNIFFNGVELVKPIKNYRLNFYNTILETQLLNFESVTNYSYARRCFCYKSFSKLLEKNQDLFDFMEKDEKVLNLPIDFFSKFDIRCLWVFDLQDDNHNQLGIFLSKCECIYELRIMKFNLTQLLINQLSVCSQTLCKLSLIDINNKESDKLNFDCLFEFKYLFMLNLDVELDTKLAPKLFKNCKKLKSLNFNLLKRKIKLQKHHFLKTFITNRENLNNFQESLYASKYPEWGYYFSESSLKYVDENFKYNPLFIVTHFNENISVVGLNYNQFVEYLKEIPQLVENEIKKGNDQTFFGFFD